MSIKPLVSFCLVLLLALLVGCTKKPMPDGMPTLYRVSISVTQEGKPLADATVSLRYADSSAGTWAVGGRTGAEGTANLFTNGYRGAPVGAFKVLLFKQENEGLKEYSESANFEDAQRIKVKIWSCLKEEYNDPEKTPLEVEITSSTKTLKVDAGPAVKIEQPFVP